VIRERDKADAIPAEIDGLRYLDEIIAFRLNGPH
jgi:hypothetical protein